MDLYDEFVIDVYQEERELSGSDWWKKDGDEGKTIWTLVADDLYENLLYILREATAWLLREELGNIKNYTTETEEEAVRRVAGILRALDSIPMGSLKISTEEDIVRGALSGRVSLVMFPIMEFVVSKGGLKKVLRREN